MNRLRNRLIVAFLAATVAPFAAALWITTSLLDRSLAYATTSDLDRLSRTLESTVRQFYQRERDALKQDALAGRTRPLKYVTSDTRSWPQAVRVFWDSGEGERFGLSGSEGGQLDYMRRVDGEDQRGVELFSRDLRGLHMDQLSRELRQTREVVESIESRDLRRGFTLTLLLLLAAAWLVSLLPLVFIAHRISQPIQQLTAGLTEFAAGDWSRRLPTRPEQARRARDEVDRAIDAFNRMAEQLRQNRERLVYLAQMASWQALARKTAHELKNSLTPIRLTVEEIQARQFADRAFIDQAVQIVVSEIDSLERRVRAFSEFASEPDVELAAIDVNTLVAERVRLEQLVHPETIFRLRLEHHQPYARAAADLVKGILTNLLQNAADAAGAGGQVLVVTRANHGDITVEVHDSGPGLSPQTAARLFEPTITFKKGGMGLGLSIAKKNAILCNGDIALTASELGGAAFRVTLTAADAHHPEPAV